MLLTLPETPGALITAAGEIVSGMGTGAANFIGSLYGANSIGQLIVLIGTAGAIVAFGKGLFLRRTRL